MKTSLLDTIVPHYIVDSTGKKTGVILDLKTFHLIIDQLEELHDVMHAERILIEGDAQEGRTLEEIEKSLHKKD